MPGTLSEEGVLDVRPRICALAYLREAYRTTDGTVGFRCPAEPVNVYESKGGDQAATEGRACICNAHVATIAPPQIRAGRLVEPGIITMGDDLPGGARFLRPDATAYTAAHVIADLVSC